MRRAKKEEDRAARADDPPARAAPEPPAPAPADWLLGLQQGIGNQAVASMLTRKQGPQQLKPREKPVVDAWDVRLEPTQKPHQGEGKPRVIKGSLKEGSPKVFVGDAVIVRAHVKNLDDETYKSLAANIRLEGGVELIDMQREGTEVLRWRLFFRAPGTAKADFDVELAPASTIGNEIRQRGYGVSFLVVQDIGHFALSCISTQSRLLSSFMAATERLNQSGNALRIAYNEQKADLEDVAASEKLASDLVLGVIFAAAGGFAGGAVGGWMKQVAGGRYAKADHIVDAAKDTVKFAVRSVQKTRGGTRLTTAGDSTSPTLDQLPTLRGDRAPTGEDPVEFLTRLGARVSAEGKHVQDLFTAVVEKARTSGADEFDEDPASVLANARQLEEIATTLPIEKGTYVKKLWQTWLENYAYKAVDGEVKDQVRRKLKKKIDKAASSVGEDGDDWLREFGGVSERKAKEDAAKQPKRPANPFGYG